MSRLRKWLDPFLAGAARVLDLSGQVSYQPADNPTQADWDAIAGDWQTVGNDLRSAIQQIGSNLNKSI